MLISKGVILFRIKDDKITFSETLVKGFDNIPQAFIDLFDGKNKGKMIVEI